ncbi:MAG: RpoL/Rpb11 RNA polymerase subunit family protein [Burkholderiaceae bacterium]
MSNSYSLFSKEKALLKREKSSIEITEIMGLMKGYDLVINDESHTLGFLIQSYINMIYYKDDVIIGYMNPHPLEKKIKFRIKSEHENITKFNEIFK